MSRIKLKVCGMRDPENIQGLANLDPDFVGFIFYPKSSRFANNLDVRDTKNIPKTTYKVGVFVNEDLGTLIKIVNKYGLDYAQLHGDEDLDYAKELKDKGIKVIKVFSISDSMPDGVNRYAGIADYLLFDTSTNKYGGSGKQFDWNILKNADLKIPFILSGGIQLQDIETIKGLDIPTLEGIDVNSKFEMEPGMKDLALIRKLKEQL